MVDFLDLSLLKDVIYVNIAIGISCALYSDNAFFTLQPLYLFELKFSQVSDTNSRFHLYIYRFIIFIRVQRDSAMVVAVGATFDLCSRIFLAIVSYFVQVNARHIYLTGAIASIIIRCSEFKCN